MPFHAIAIREMRAGKAALRVRIGKPGRDPAPGGDWCCAYEITLGKRKPIIRYAYGVDSFQALQHAQVALKAHVVAIGRKVHVTWLEGNELQL